MSSALEAYVVLALLFLVTTGFGGCAIGNDRNLSVNSSIAPLVLDGVRGESESLLFVSLSVERWRLSPLDRGLTTMDANCDREVGGRL
jgi:hypothetical protein